MSTAKPAACRALGEPAGPGSHRPGAPLDPSTWRASLAIVLGFGVEVLAFVALTATFSTGGSLLFLLVGIPIIGLGIEIARMVARVERWRMTLVDRRPLRPHLYRTFDGGPFRLSRALAPPVGRG